MLEQCGARWLVGTADEVGWTVHFHCSLLPILQSNERVDAIPGDLTAMLFLYMGNTRADFSYNIGLKLGRYFTARDESGAAGLA